MREKGGVSRPFPQTARLIRGNVRVDNPLHRFPVNRFHIMYIIYGILKQL